MRSLPLPLRRKRLLASLLLAALGGCNFAPTYQAPSTPVPEQFDRSGEAEGARAANEIGWQEFFGDPRLRLLIGMALQDNRDLAASVARVEQARALYRIQQAERLPQVGVGAGATRTGAPLAALEPGLETGSSATAVFNQYNVQAALSSFEIDFWGRVANLSEAARRRYLATLEGERAFRLALIANVAATYYAIVSTQEGIELARRTLESRRYGLEIARLRLDAGVTSLTDYDQARILVAQAEGQLAELRRNAGQLDNRLMILVGGPLPEGLPAPRPIGDPGQFDGVAAGLPSDLLVLRPDILQAEQQLRAADADIGVARAAWFPRIALTGSFGYVSPDLGSLLQGDRQIWSAGASASLPLFDGGQRSAALAQTQARRDELVANYQHTVQNAFAEVSDALVARRRYHEQTLAQEEAVAAQKRLAETAELRYQNGISIYLEVVDAKRSQFSAEQQLIQLRALELQNAVSLYVALGGGACAATKGLSQGQC